MSHGRRKMDERGQKMARLIDADLLVLEEQSLEDIGQDKMEFYSPEQIDNAPTVEAYTKEEVLMILKKIQRDISEIMVDAIIQEKIKQLDQRGGSS